MNGIMFFSGGIFTILCCKNTFFLEIKLKDARYMNEKIVLLPLPITAHHRLIWTNGRKDNLQWTMNN